MRIFPPSDRVELIRDVLMLSSKISSGELFRECRKHGYSLNYKSFQRDLIHCESIYNIRKEIFRGGSQGATTLWELVS